MSSFRHLCCWTCVVKLKRKTNRNRFESPYVNICSVYGLEQPCKLCYPTVEWSNCLEKIKNYLYTKTCKTLQNALVQPLYYCFDTTVVLTKRLGSARGIEANALASILAFRKIHVREGKNVRDPSERKSKHTWSDCAFLCIPFILTEISKECWLHTWSWMLGMPQNNLKIRIAGDHISGPSGYPQLSGLIPTSSLFQQNHCPPFEEGRKRAQRLI